MTTYATMTKQQLIEALESAQAQISYQQFQTPIVVEKDKGLNRMSIKVSSFGAKGTIEVRQEGETYDVALESIPTNVLATLLGYGIKQHLADSNVKGKGSLSEYKETIESLYLQGFTSKREKDAANKSPEVKAKGVKVGSLSRESFEMWCGENIEDGESIMQSLAALDTPAFWLFMSQNAPEVVEAYKEEAKAKAEAEAKAKAEAVAASLPSLTFKRKAS